PGRFAARLREIAPEPDAVARAVSGLLVHPMLAPLAGVEMPASPADGQGLRAGGPVPGRPIARGDALLTTAPPPERGPFCVCAGFARLATSVFRVHALAARCRCGFATYFNPGHLEDHWVCEYWDGAAWHLLDAQLGDRSVHPIDVDFAPTDVPRDRFLDAS